MTRFAPPLIVLLLCGTALAGCASDDNGMLSDLHRFQAYKPPPCDGAAAPTDVDSGVRQAHALDGRPV